MRNRGFQHCFVAVAAHMLCLGATGAYAQPKIPALPTNVPGLPALDPQALRALAPPTRPDLDKGSDAPAVPSTKTNSVQANPAAVPRPTTRGAVRPCKVEFTPKGTELKAEASQSELRLTFKGDRGCLKAASSEELWVEANLRSAKQEVLLQVEENSTYEPRKARVFLVAGEDQLEFIVTQAGVPAPKAQEPTPPVDKPAEILSGSAKETLATEEKVDQEMAGAEAAQPPKEKEANTEEPRESQGDGQVQQVQPPFEIEKTGVSASKEEPSEIAKDLAATELKESEPPRRDPVAEEPHALQTPANAQAAAPDERLDPQRKEKAAQATSLVEASPAPEKVVESPKVDEPKEEAATLKGGPGTEMAPTKKGAPEDVPAGYEEFDLDDEG